MSEIENTAKAMADRQVAIHNEEYAAVANAIDGTHVHAEVVNQTLEALSAPGTPHVLGTVPAVTVRELSEQEIADREAAHAVSEESYQTLRSAVARQLSIAIKSGKVLLQEKAVEIAGHVVAGPISFATWYSALPELAQQFYNCRHCRSMWQLLGSYATLDSKGHIEYPAVTALLENMDDPIVAKIFANSPSLLGDLRDNGKLRTVHYMPVGLLPETLGISEAGGFGHFYAASPETIQQYNSGRAFFNDLEYVKNLFSNMVDPRMNPESLRKLFVYVKNAIGEKDYTALSRSEAFCDLVASVQAIEKSAKLGMVYLWSLLQEVKYNWLKHVGGSVLGVVVDSYFDLKGSDNMERGLHQVKQLLSLITSAENYKQKSAVASEASLDQCFEFLAANKLHSTLERRLLPFTEVLSVIWEPTHAEPTDEDPGTEVEAQPSALEVAYKALKEKKNENLQADKALDALVSNSKAHDEISAAAFVRMLPNIAELSLMHKTIAVNPFIVTGAVGEGDHDKLLTFDDSVGKHASLIGVTTPLSFNDALFLSHPDGDFDPRSPTARKIIEVEAVFTTSRFRDGSSESELPALPVFQIRNFAYNFQKLQAAHGSCILGTMVRSEHFGYSRSLTELACKIPMVTHAGGNAAGGVFMQIGLVFDVLFKDGKRSEITIATLI